MKDICIVPAFERPEILHECLERITIAIGDLDITVIVSVDSERLVNYAKPYPSHNQEVLDVADSFKRKIRDLIIYPRMHHVYHGNSFNTLEALKEAYHAGPRFVFLVEDDVMVAADFFQFHYACHDVAQFFASIGVKCTRRKVDGPEDSEKIWVSGSDYASLGVCFPHNTLSYIIPHARPEYYSDMNSYTRREFPNSRFKNEFSEQDGLIIRIMGYWNGLCAWPYVPRAFHAGYYGYHRLDSAKPIGGSLEERIKDFKDLMFDDVALSILNPDNADIIPCSLDGCQWKHLDINETFG